MDAIKRAKRRFFLRPGYIVRHFGDVAQARRHEAGDLRAGASRTIFGSGRGYRRAAASHALSALLRI